VSQKRVLSQHSAVEVRLNRALEEVERYRDALQKAKSDAKVRGVLASLLVKVRAWLGYSMGRCGDVMATPT
jgi:uncharacterized protein YecT (DUF1311 family)